MDIGDIFRKATRPIVTIIFSATIAQIVTQGIDAPEWFIGIAGTVIGWWFIDRTVQKAKNGTSDTKEVK